MRALQTLWGAHARGVVWLALSTALNLVLGLALQVIALRQLSSSDYALFVLGLAVGNVASAIASAIQPVVAVRSLTGARGFMPLGPWQVVAVLAAGAALSVVLALTAGPAVWPLLLAQIPIHAAIAVGLGHLQASHRFGAVAASLSSWSLARFILVCLLLAVHRGSGVTFVVVLPLALVANLLLELALGAFHGVTWQRAGDSGQLASYYGFWALLGWLFNQDAVLSRFLLASQPLGRYATAFTIGRQPLYAVGPLTTVLLPVTASSQHHEQRRRYWAVVAIAVLQAALTMLVLGVFPSLVTRLLLGHSEPELAGLVRGYAVVGSLAAAAYLLATFVFALDSAPRPRIPLVITLAFAGMSALAVRSSGQLLALQGLSCAALVAVYAYIGLDATSTARHARLDR